MKRNLYPLFSASRFIAILLVLAGISVPVSHAQWSNLYTGFNVFDVAPVNDSTWFMSEYYVLKKTTDRGATWTTMIPYLSDNNIEGMYFMDENTYWVAGYDNGTTPASGWVYYTTNGGASFQSATTPNTYGYLTDIWFTSATTGFVTTVNGKILKSTNGGASWSLNYGANSNTLRCIRFYNSTTGIAAGANGTVLLTTDGGTSWSAMNTSSGGNFADAGLISATEYCVAGADGIYYSSDSGSSWTQVLNQNITKLDFPSATQGYAVGSGGVYKSVNPNLLQWVGVNNPNTSYFNFTSVFFMTNMHGYVSTMLGIWETTNGADGCPTVNAGADQYVCDTIAQLIAHPSANNNYPYTWTPAAGLSATTNDTTVASNLTPGSFSQQQYVVELIDVISGCSGIYDTVVVTFDPNIFTPNYTQPTNIINVCEGDSVLLQPGTGLATYNWSGQPLGVSTSAAVWADTADFQWMVTVTDACGTAYGYFFIIQPVSCDSVWPGDANYDGTADMYDLLNLGIGFGATGPSRTDQSIGWYAHETAAWSQSFVNIGINYKHADCDGNGSIGYSDTTAIIQNYGFQHALLWDPVPGPNDPPLYFENLPTDLSEGTAFTIPVFIGNSAFPVTDFYGGAFSINYDTTYIKPGSVHVTFGPSFAGTVGTDAIAITKNLPTSQRIDVAIARTDHTPVSGYGELAQLHIIMQDDIVALLPTNQDELQALIAAMMSLSFDNEKFIDHQENEIPVNPLPNSYNVQTGVDPSEQIHVQLYPNPATDYIVFSAGEYPLQTLTIETPDGRVVYTSASSATTQLVNVANLPAGMYLVRYTLENGTAGIQKLVKR